MKKVFFILLHIPLVMLVSCGSNPKAPAQSSEQLKATVSSQTNDIVIGILTLDHMAGAAHLPLCA